MKKGLTDFGLSMKETDSKSRYDASAKKLLSYKGIVARVLKYLTVEFAFLDVDYIERECIISCVVISEKAVHQDQPDRSGDEVAVMLNSESSSVREGRVFYDLRFRARAPGASGDVLLMVNLEMQKDDRTPYAIVTRGIYYCARMLSEQYGTVFTNMDYQNIEKVYSIWICPEPAAGKKDSIVRYSITEEVVRGESFIEKKDYDKMEVVVINLGDGTEDSDHPAVGLLSTLFSTKLGLEERMSKLESRYGLQITKELKSGVTEVCNLSEGIEERGRRKGLKEGITVGRKEGIAVGRKEGIAIGREKGLTEGRKEGSLSVLFQLVDEGDLSLEKAAEKANMTVEEFLKKKSEWKRNSNF